MLSHPDDGIVVSEVWKGKDVVDLDSVPSALRDKLGGEGTVGFLQVLDRAQHHVKDSVFTACGDRFERRLVEETSSLRVQIAQLAGSLRQETAQMGADLREEMAQIGADLREEIARMGADIREEMARRGADLREEMARMGADLRNQIVESNATLRQDMLEMNGKVRHEIAEMGADLRSDIANGRVELFKWCFLFWIGQVLAIGTLMAVMLRLAR